MKALFFPVFLFASMAFADSQIFTTIMKQRKGPFGPNVLQGVATRVTVDQPPPDGFQFQAAFRNELAQDLANRHSLYLGNLFTTNYYELMGEFVFNDPRSSHPLEHEKLIGVNAQAMSKAFAMVQHTLLEKHYIQFFPNSALARAFRLRGISGSEFETIYARHFFNFYFSSLSDQFHYLPGFLLFKNSSVLSAASLQSARDMIGESYEFFKTKLGPNDLRVVDMYKIRNSIHNQLNPSVIGLIESYLTKHTFYKDEGHTSLFKILDILKSYYSFGADKVLVHAQKLGMAKIQNVTNRIIASGPQTTSLLDLSELLSELRSNIHNPKWLPWNKKAQALNLISTGSQYLAKEVSGLPRAQDPKLLMVVLNTIYLEGFLLQDNWKYFKDEIEKSTDYQVAIETLKDAVDISTDTLNESYKRSLQQWTSIEPKMTYFIDNTIKASAVSTAVNLIEGR